MADNEEQINIPNESIQRAESIRDSMLEIRNASRDANIALKEQGEMLTDFGGLYGSINRSASKVAEIQERATRSSKATAQATAEQTKQLSIVERLNTKINDLTERALKLQGDAKDAVMSSAKALAAARDNAKGLADNYGSIAEDAAKLDARTSFFDAFGDLAANSKVFKQFAKPFRDAATAARQTAISNTKGGKKMSVLASGAKGFAKSSFLSAKNFMKSGGYIGVIAQGITGVVKLMLAIDANSAKTAASFNETKKAAAATAFNFQVAASGMNYLTGRIGKGLELARGFADATGIMSKNTAIFNSDLDILNQKFGLTTDQTNDLAKNLLASGQNTKQFTAEALGAAEALEMQLGVNIQSQAIMQDVAASSAAFKVNSGFSAVALGNAAAQARKVGLSLSQVENISSGLLDFENSISAEMTAQLMTGKNLDLSKARQAALTGDLATVAQEIAKQEAVQEAFATNNVLAQESVAKALNMSREELAKMYTDQRALEKAGFATADAREAEYQRLTKIHGSTKALKMIGMEQFTTMKNNVSFQEKMNNLVENLKSIFMTSIEPVVANITGMLESNPAIINDLVEKVKKFAEGLGGPEGSINKMLGSFKSMKMIVKGIGQILNATLIQPLKVAYHVVMALVEGFKAVAYAKSFQMDLAKEAAAKAVDHGALAITNTLDIGTGIAAGIATMSGVENMNATGISDAYKGTGGASGELNVNDFTLKTNPKDTITMAGGTKLGGNVEKLLKELIDEVKKGGDVIMDGNKVGSTIALGAKLSN